MRMNLKYSSGPEDALPDDNNIWTNRDARQRLQHLYAQKEWNSSAGWMLGPKLLTDRTHHSSCVIAQKLFLVGGVGRHFQPNKEIEFIGLKRW